MQVLKTLKSPKLNVLTYNCSYLQWDYMHHLSPPKKYHLKTSTYVHQLLNGGLQHPQRLCPLPLQFEYVTTLLWRPRSWVRILFFGRTGCLVALSGRTMTSQVCSHCLMSRVACTILLYDVRYVLDKYQCLQNAYGS